jgi:hypothetical protein
MWLVNPKTMCRNHLLGEHLELHKLEGCLKKGKNMKGYLERGLVDPSLLTTRHDEVVAEMKRRGYRHLSPIMASPGSVERGQIDPKANALELARRCPRCKEISDIKDI